MFVYNLLDDRQAQPGARGARFPSGCTAEEALEEMGLFVERNARTGITDAYGFCCKKWKSKSSRQKEAKQRSGAYATTRWVKKPRSRGNITDQRLWGLLWTPVRKPGKNLGRMK
jgi:hypothetical protein